MRVCKPVGARLREGGIIKRSPKRELGETENTGFEGPGVLPPEKNQTNMEKRYWGVGGGSSFGFRLPGVRPLWGGHRGRAVTRR